MRRSLLPDPLRPWARRTLRAGVALCAASPLVAAAAGAACPDLSGRFGLYGDPRVLGDATQALGIGRPAHRDDVERRHLVLRSIDGGRVLSVRAPGVDEAGDDRRPPLAAGVDYDCQDGWVTLRSAVEAGRPAGQEMLVGESRVRLRAAGGAGLRVEVAFKGQKRATLFAYDSANLSVPLPFTGNARVEVLELPPVEMRPPPDPQRLEEDRVQAELRRWVEPLLRPVSPNVVHPLPGGGARALLRARRSEDLIAMEDGLRASRIDYEYAREPSWYDNAYGAELRLRPPGAGQAPGRVSAFRVNAELERLMLGGASVDKVQRLGASSYVAEVTLRPSDNAERLADTMGARSTLIERVVALPADPPRAGDPRVKLRWLVTLRP